MNDAIPADRQGKSLTRKPAMKTRNSGQFVHFAAPRRCWGRLQSRVLYCLVDGCGKASGDEISRYCWDAPPTPLQVHSQGRAARSIGAKPVRREGRRWIWRLESSSLGYRTLTGGGKGKITPEEEK